MNDENSYNLIDEAWIPVLMKDGSNRAVSLGEIFADTDGAIADLALNPYERVAVFRLLLCIAQAALGPDRLKDEDAWKAAKSDVGPISADYLRKWHHRFFLYGPHAFLQPDDVKTSKDAGTGTSEHFNSDVSKLCLARASGNNSTLFDHGATDCVRGMSDSERIIGFLVFQSFSAGGRFSQCRWEGMLSPTNNEKGKPNNALAAPCREKDMLFSILIGSNLSESIWLNLLCKDILDSAKIPLGSPIWESNTISRAKMLDTPRSYLGHLVPLSRIVKLFQGSEEVIMGEGVIYPTLNPDKKNPDKRSYGWREPMATVKSNGDDPPDYVSSDLTRLPWRDLASILAINGNNGSKSALALRNIESLPDEKEFVLWMGGLCTSQAKEIGVVEWFARLSIEWLEDSSIQRYRTAIKIAETQCNHLISAAISYSESMKMSKVKEDKKEIYRPTDISESAYWDILAQPENQKIVMCVESETYMDDWKEATHKAAEEAYRRACPAVTARQMEAFAQGFAKLWVPDRKKDKADGSTDSEEPEGDDYV
ncbi:MAG: type I-E CRISPR-associated protein Cse1/CasA [Kiritimatiellae bacterium]|nr:type I-E CRISPR-associated protein Cse1/CasA [Kiritimatiellia bacterium]